MSTLRRMLVAHDGSTGAARALEWAGGLARQTGAEVVVVQAWSLLDEVGRYDPPLPPHQGRDAARARLHDEWCAELAAAGVPFESRLVEDLPVPAIVETADDVDADLIVCGTRGLGGVKGLVLGSVASELPRRSHRPVAIIPPA